VTACDTEYHSVLRYLLFSKLFLIDENVFQVRVDEMYRNLVALVNGNTLMLASSSWKTLYTL